MRQHINFTPSQSSMPVKIDEINNSEEFTQKNRTHSNQPIKQLKKQALLPPKPKIIRNNMEIWEDFEIKKIFQLYREHGSQWKIIASRFPERPSNSIKNRFYTVIRNLLKQIFYFHPTLPKKIPRQISSKIILKFYEGRAQFEHLGNLGKILLEQIDFEVNENTSRYLSQKYEAQVKQIFELIFEGNENEDFSSEQKNGKESFDVKMCQQKNANRKPKSLPEKPISQREEVQSPLYKSQICQMNQNMWIYIGENNMNNLGQIYYYPQSAYPFLGQNAPSPGIFYYNSSFPF